jgi:mannose-1-phosphate guanylyltransferase
VEEQHLLGSAGDVTGESQLDCVGEPLWIFYADVLNCADFDGMLRLHGRTPAATLGVYEVPDPGLCGIVTTNDDGVIEQFVEKPMNPSGNLAFSG